MRTCFPLKRCPILSVELLLLFVLSAPGAVQAASFQSEGKTFRSDADPNKDKRKILWEGDLRIDHLERSVLGGKDLWVLGTTGKILITDVGDSGPEDVLTSRELPGRLLSLDFYPFPNRPGQGLLTVSYALNDILKSRVYQIKQPDDPTDPPRLRRFTTETRALIRPLGSFLYAQEVTPYDGWGSGIVRLHTKRSGYERGQPLAGPDSLRLLSLASIPGTKAKLRAGVDAKGNLVLLRKGRVLDTVEGNYARSGRSIREDRVPRPDRREPEPLRLPPAASEQGPILAVPTNPKPTSGLQSWLADDPISFLNLFEVRNETLREVRTLGPYRGRLLDLEFMKRGNGPLVWLRRNSGRTYLEELSGSS